MCNYITVHSKLRHGPAPAAIIKTPIFSYVSLSDFQFMKIRIQVQMKLRRASK